MNIAVKDLSITQLAEPSIIIRGGRVIYSLNFRPEYDGPSEDGPVDTWDPDSVDHYGRLKNKEEAFDE